jgi:hypothetical protein
MNASDDEISKKIDTLKALASRRIDEILKARIAVQQRESGMTLINSLFGWFKK